MDLLKCIKICISIIFGAIFYLIGLVIFLITPFVDNAIFILIKWALLPITTAFGFAFGIWLFERKLIDQKSSFRKILAWTLVGCIIPSIIVFPFGPMLIVFAMCFGGTLSVILREVFLNRRSV